MIGEPPLSFKEIIEKCRDEVRVLLRCDFGISYLDDTILGMGPGDLTLVGARSGGGKTEFATQVLLNQQDIDKNRAKSVLYFAIDHEQGEIENRVIWRLLTQQIRLINDPRLNAMNLRYTSWRAGKYGDMFDELVSDSRMHIKALISMSETRFLYRRNEFTAEKIAEIIRANDRDFNLFIIDHFHAIIGTGEFEAQAEAMRVISNAAEEAERPVLMLGQFRKPSGGGKLPPIPDMYEFSGSSQMIYLPQNIIILAPRYSETADRWDTYFQVVKSRHAADTITYVGVHSFDMRCRQYSEKYQILRYFPLGEPKQLEGKKPSWAVHGIFSDDIPPTQKSNFFTGSKI